MLEGKARYKSLHAAVNLKQGIKKKENRKGVLGGQEYKDAAKLVHQCMVSAV